MTSPAPIERIREAFLHQANWCTRLGSPFTAALLHALIPQLTETGAVRAIIGDWKGDPIADILALRVTGALHALVLSGKAEELAPFYPPNKQPDHASLVAATAEFLPRHAGFISDFLISPPQTNEVARAAVLLGGFLTIAAATKTPLRLLEIGASAGLNLLWDKFHYRLGHGTEAATWGDPASPVQLVPDWSGGLPDLAAPITISRRAGCDIAPIDVTDAQARLRLRAYVWPDQTARLERLTGALSLGQQNPVLPEAANATDFLRRHLAQTAPGETTVLYHSIMWNYVAAADRDDITSQMREAGARATAAAPLAWLRYEIPGPDALPTLELTMWPYGVRKTLATAHPHGASIAWAE